MKIEKDLTRFKKMAIQYGGNNYYCAGLDRLERTDLSKINRIFFEDKSSYGAVLCFEIDGKYFQLTKKKEKWRSIEWLINEPSGPDEEIKRARRMQLENSIFNTLYNKAG